MTKRAAVFAFTSVLTLFLLMLAGCGSSAPIAMEQFGGVSDIPEGEDAFIYWTFINADYVKVAGDEKRYAVSDRMTVRPASTTNYRITAYRSDDSLSQEWTVNVYRSPERQARYSDPAGSAKSASTPNTPSSGGYFRGGQADPGAKPAQVKIIKFSPYSIDDKNFNIKVVACDESGDFIPGKSKDASEGEWYGRYSCSEISEEHKAATIVERRGESSAPAIAIALDRSYGAEEFGDAPFQQTKAFINEISNDCLVNFSVFNQAIKEQIPLISADSASIMADYLSAPAPEGLAALYRAADYAIGALETSPNKNKAVILITNGSDNASVLFTAEDAAEHARRTGVTIYAIAMGEASQLYAIRYLTMKTGGRLYHVSNGNIADIAAILKEITEGQTSYYDLSFPSPGNTQSCDAITSSVVLPSNGISLSDKTTIFDRRPPDAPIYQSVALFAEENAVISDEYKSLIKQLATALRGNPDKKIELLGHSSLSITDADASSLAMQRAQAVKRLLVASGVEDNRIRIRSVGNRKPAYYFEDAQWQATSNRRVDIRWLDPSLLPFEISAQRVASEDEAMRFTEEWARRGVKSYYERTMVKRSPMYTIKLWGYSSYEEAANAAKFLSKQYKVDLQPE